MTTMQNYFLSTVVSKLIAAYVEYYLDEIDKVKCTTKEDHDGLFMFLQHKLKLSLEDDFKYLSFDRNEKELIRIKSNQAKTENTELHYQSIEQKVIDYVKENYGGQISHKEANQMAWKKQNWIPGGADIVTFRSLIKQTIRGIDK